MLDLVQLIQRLSQLATGPLLLALIATAVGIVIVRNWRLTLPVMIAQYVMVGILVARAVQPGLAFIKVVAGVLVCLALSIAAQRADDTRLKRGESVAGERIQKVAWRSVPAQLLIRAVACALVLTVAFGATQRFPLPNIPRELELGAYALSACALLVIAMAPEALNIGLGLLMLMSGIELGYTLFEPSVSVGVILGLATLAVGLAIAYLTLADSEPAQPEGAGSSP